MQFDISAVLAREISLTKRILGFADTYYEWDQYEVLVTNHGLGCGEYT